LPSKHNQHNLPSQHNLLNPHNQHSLLSLPNLLKRLKRRLTKKPKSTRRLTKSTR
jgi:hypothetical protein